MYYSTWRGPQAQYPLVSAVSSNWNPYPSVQDGVQFKYRLLWAFASKN